LHDREFEHQVCGERAKDTANDLRNHVGWKLAPWQVLAQGKAE
jgi:hypothetical protein